jgi:monoamine oxidase
VENSANTIEFSTNRDPSPSRRHFLFSSLAAPVLASLAPSRRAAPAAYPIGVIGAGLAGLRAADILRKAGQRVVVLEARAVPGGRVRTFRSVFTDALYAEAGAIRISAAHYRVLQLVREHGLVLLPFSSSAGSSLVSVRGQTVRSPADLAALGAALGLKPEEAGSSPGALVNRYVGGLAGDLAEVTPTPAAYERWQAHDRMTWPDWLRSRGASAGAVALMTLGGDSSQLSALYVLRQVALHGKSDQFYKIQGGMDLLPRALAQSLGASVRYHSAVTRLDLAPRAAHVHYQERGVSKLLTLSRVVIAVPFSTLRRIDVRPAWPQDRAAAIAAVPYFPAVRFLLQATSRFWEPLGLNGSARTDQPAEIWDCTYDLPSDRGVLGATTGGAIGDRLGAMSQPEALRFGVDLAARTFPGIRSRFEKGTAIRWAQEPWSRGAFAVFRPGQMTSIMPVIAQPEGRVHFAGEHTSSWMGWMEGALESGERAAREVLAAEGGADAGRR